MCHARDVARDAARGVIESLAAAGGIEPVAVRVEAPGVRVVVRVVVVRPRRRRRAPTACETDLLRLLACATCPWPTTRVLAELESRGMHHGEATVKRTLARLRAAGLVASSATPPRGYSLAAG